MTPSFIAIESQDFLKIVVTEHRNLEFILELLKRKINYKIKE